MKWATPDILNEKTLKIQRFGCNLSVSNERYDGGHRQQFHVSIDGRRFKLSYSTCDHDLGVIGHMHRAIGEAECFSKR